MLTTEAEAKTKRCQESFPACTQVSDGGHISSMSYAGGAYAVPTAPTMCLGSACMAWRWAFTSSPFSGVEQTSYGYCGKAGPATGIVDQ